MEENDDVKMREMEKDLLGAKACLASPDGQKLLRVLERWCVFSSMMADTPERTAYNLGKRDLALQLLRLAESHDRR